MRFLVLFFAVSLAVPVAARGADVAPATSDEADPVGKGKALGHDKDKKDNFGQKVSAEAHKLKADGTKGNTFGKWVSAQRRQDGDHADHGKSGDPHGKSGDPHGKSGDSHGKSGESHGKSGH